MNEQVILTNYKRQREIFFMKLTHEELKNLIKEALTDSTKAPALGGLAGAIGGIPQDAQQQASGANDVVNLFLSAFGLGGGTKGGGAAISGDSWVGLEGRQVWQALKNEFGITVSKDWYKKLPYNHQARVKFREWWNNKNK